MKRRPARATPKSSPKSSAPAPDVAYVTRLVDIRQRSWFGNINRIAEGLARSGETPAQFSKLMPADELKVICKKNNLPSRATKRLHMTALTLFLAYRRAQPRAMADIRRELRDLIPQFQRLSKAIGRLDFEIELELDVYVERQGPKKGQFSYYRTADPHLEMFKQNLDEFLERARAIKLPKSEGGRKKAFPTLALGLLAAHLRKIKPSASSRDLARLAQGLFDTILPGELPPPLWRQRASELWPNVPSRVKSNRK